LNTILTTVSGYAAAAVLFWFWIEAREDLAAQVEACNADKLRTVAEAEHVARQAEREAAARTVAELVRITEQTERARLAALRAAQLAESRPAEVREVIRRVTDPTGCLRSPVPAAVAERLRSD